MNIIEEILEDGKEYLQQLRETYKREYPDFIHDIPLQSVIRLVNCEKIILITNNCNRAHLLRRFVINKISKAHNELDEDMYY